MKKRIASIFVTLCLCAALLPVGANAADDYPYSGTPAGTYIVDDWNFYRGECTSFVAFRLNNNNGVAFTNWYGGIRWSNANNWDDAARSLGIVVDNTPAVGAVAQSDSGSTGHVAWVSAVDGSRVTIEEYNYGYVKINGEYVGNHKYNTRTVNSSDFCYIHIQDITTNRPSIPSKPTVSVNGAAVMVSWNDVADETSYNVYLVQAPWSWEDIKYQGSVSANKTSYTFDPVKPGAYKAFVIAMPNGAEAQSEWTEFSVVWPKPTNQPTATVVGRDVTISWNNVSDEVGYNIYLVQSPWSWEDIKYQGNVAKDVTKYTFKNVAPGDYKAFVISMPNGAETQSPWVSLTVPTQSASTEVSSVTLNKSSLSLKTGESETLSATVQSNNPKDVTVTWSSSNTKVATVSGGKVTAVAAGTATITAKAGSKSATCTVTVSEATVAVTGISLNNTSISLATGASTTLTANITPSNATDKTLTWTSSDTKVAIVNNGKVTAVAAGTATITAKAGSKSATCKVTVTNASVPVTSVKLSRTTLSLTAGETATLTATVSPENATDKNIVWTSDNEAVATVNNGVVTAVSAGTAIISAQAGGKSQSCAVTITGGEYSFEISAYIDGVTEINYGTYGMADIYINGVLVAPSCGLYTGTLRSGTTYEIKNITPQSGYKFDGVYSGSLSGTIKNGAVKVILQFSKDTKETSNVTPTVEGQVSVVKASNLTLDNLTYTYNAGGREAEANPGVVGSFSISFTVNGGDSVCKVRGYAPRNSNPTENEINTLATQQAAKGKQESGFNTANADGKPPFRGGIGTKPVTTADLDATRYVIVLGFDRNTDVVGYAVLKVVVGATSDTVFSGEVQTDATELPSAWAQAEVSTAIDVGLVPMNLQQNYTKPVSRADVAQMFINLIEQSSGKDIDRLMNEKGVSINKDAFTDTSDYAVLAANALGIINGTGNSRFSPDGTFTRSQIAAIINRVARVLGVNTNGYTHSFTDVVGHWVDSELGWPSSVGIINGVGNNQFSPDTELTTEQAIAITYRALQILK